MWGLFRIIRVSPSNHESLKAGNFSVGQEEKDVT